MKRVILGAALLAALGCGKIPVAEVDGGGGDIDGGGDQIDAAPPAADAAVGSASVIVFHDDGTPVVGAEAILTHADGTSLLSAVSDATGTVELVVTAGDVLHVGFLENTQLGDTESRLFSVVAIEPGDLIKLNEHRPPPTNVGTLSIKLPNGAVTGAAQYELDLGCTSNGTTVANTQFMFGLDSRCVKQPGNTYTAVATATSTDGTVLAHSVLRDSAFVSGTVVSMPGWVSVSSSPLAAGTAQLSSLSSDAQTIQFQASPLRGALDYRGVEFEIGGGPPGQAFDFALVPGFATSVQAQAIQLHKPAGSGTGYDGVQLMVERRDVAQNADLGFSFDFGETLPRFYSSSVALNGTIATFAWMTEGTAAQVDLIDQADFIILGSEWTKSGATGGVNSWMVIAPAHIGSPFALDLHELAEGFGPDPTMTITSFVQMLSLDVIQGYNDFKNNWGTALFDGLIDQQPSFVGALSASTLGF